MTRLRSKTFVWELRRVHPPFPEKGEHPPKPTPQQMFRQILDFRCKRMNTTVIGLGSNIQSRKNISKAHQLLAKKFKIIKKSRFIKTKAVGPKQPDFINGAVLVKTSRNFRGFKRCLKEIEQALGRKPRHRRYDPRTIDLDILAWNGRIVDPDFFKRKFLQKSLGEVVDRNWLVKDKS